VILALPALGGTAGARSVPHQRVAHRFTYYVYVFSGSVVREPTGRAFDADTTRIKSVRVNGVTMIPYDQRTLYRRTFVADQSLVQITFPTTSGPAVMTAATTLPTASISVTFN
jgi:hypothetical protein